MNKTLNGPAINFSPGEFDKIIIFLHGYGANGNDLISIGNDWKKEIIRNIYNNNKILLLILDVYLKK